MFSDKQISDVNKCEERRSHQSSSIYYGMEKEKKPKNSGN